MIKNHTADKQCAYDWIDIVNPQVDELEGIAKKYGLHEESLRDCLQPGHLPKYERLKNYTFIILRVYAEGENNKADTVQEVTSKIAIFLGEQFIITIHRRGQPIIDRISAQLVDETVCKQPRQVLMEIVSASLTTYDRLSHELNQLMEYYETQVFLTERTVSLLKGLYFIKRKINVVRRLLLLTQDIIDKIDPPDASNAYTRDIRDLYVKLRNIYDVLSDNSNHLLNIYFNVSAQRTNKTMRVLTIFSVFFMPLTFIAGIYGMNFKYMPELEWRYGYPAVMAFMVMVVVFIYWWFRKNKWL